MHSHNFSEENWPFAESVNVAAISTVHVLNKSKPILLVTHDADDGSWQVLCGTTNDPTEGRVLCLGCLFAQDPTIGELADLPMGWQAWRTAVSTHWERSPQPTEIEA